MPRRCCGSTRARQAQQVAELLRVGRRTVYHWLDRLDDRDGLDLKQRLADAPRPGRPRAGDDGVDPWTAEIIDADPRALGCHQTVWTAPLLVRYLCSVSTVVAQTGFSWK